MIVPLLLLLLSACVATGVSDEIHHQTYGDTYRMWLPRQAHSLKFIPKYGSRETILWKRGGPEASEGGRRRVEGHNYVIASLTQRDAGRYILLDKNQRVVTTLALSVTAISIFRDVALHEYLNISYDLGRASCYIYFYPRSDSELTQDQAEIVYRGQMEHEKTCEGLEFLEPCGVLTHSFQTSCSGHYEFRDASGGLAKVVYVTVNEPPYDPWHIGAGVGAALASAFCCCCVRRCCCKKRASKKDADETDSAAAPAAAPAVGYREVNTYVHRPVAVGPDRTSQPTETHHHNQPSYAPTGPLIHSPPTVNLPPSYAEVSSPAEQSSGPTAPLYSEPAIQFELKGLSFPSAPPLTSDSTFCYVYNSDKLNYI